MTLLWLQLRTNPCLKTKAKLHFFLTDRESYFVTFSLRGFLFVKDFVDHNSKMMQLKKVLLSETTYDQQKVFILYGLEGIGKTQLAVNFVSKHQVRYSSIFWLDERDKSSIWQSIVTITNHIFKGQIAESNRLHLYKDDNKNNLLIDDVLNWFSEERNQEWLLIFDNVDRYCSLSSSDNDAYEIEDNFPFAKHESILITTQQSLLCRLEVSLKLTALDNNQGRKMLISNMNSPVIDQCLRKFKHIIRVQLTSQMQTSVLNYFSCLTVFH